MANTLKLNKTPETKFETVEELRHQVHILGNRLRRTESELVAARVSRDDWRRKFLIARRKCEKAPDPADSEA